MPALLGVPFVAGGLFLGLVGLLAVTLANADEVPASVQPMLLVTGIVFGVVGAAVASGQRWATIDKTERAIVVETWMVLRLRVQVHRLDDHEVVTIDLEEGDSRRSNQFPVSLRSRDLRTLRLCTPATYEEARECAVTIADHTGLPLEDLTAIQRL